MVYLCNFVGTDATTTKNSSTTFPSHNLRFEHNPKSQNQNLQQHKNFAGRYWIIFFSRILSFHHDILFPRTFRPPSGFLTLAFTVRRCRKYTPIQLGPILVNTVVDTSIYRYVIVFMRSLSSCFQLILVLFLTSIPSLSSLLTELLRFPMTIWNADCGNRTRFSRTKMMLAATAGFALSMIRASAPSAHSRHFMATKTRKFSERGWRSTSLARKSSAEGRS